jgi:predicted dithiol-disulfide oxidoreductase (DUF899 family)
VSGEEWIEARKELLAKEKVLTADRDRLAEDRRELPWVKVEKTYIFDTRAGKKTLAELLAKRASSSSTISCSGPAGTKDARAAP